MDITKGLITYDGMYYSPKLVMTTLMNLRQDDTTLDIQYVKAYVMTMEVYYGNS